jgi:hypothetical protein
MSGLGDLWHDLAPLIGQTLGSTAAHPERGERVILRRPSTLEDVGGDGAPGILLLAAPALLGATTLSLELPSGEKMAGTLLAGARLTIGATDYTVAADASTTTAVLTATIAPGLAAPAAEGVPVTVHPEAVFTFEDCHVSKRMRRDLARPLQADHFAVVMVPAKGAPTTPKMNDSLELEDGTVGRVANQVISGGAFWKLQMGS